MNFYHILFGLKHGFNRNLTWYENLFVKFYNNTIAKLTAKILRIKGNTVSFNQLAQIPNNSSDTINDVVWANNGDGTVKANGTANGNSTYNVYSNSGLGTGWSLGNFISGHKYFIRCGYPQMANNTIRTEIICRKDLTTNYGFYVDLFGGDYIVTCANDCNNYYIEYRVFDNVNANNVVFKTQILDLTLMGIDNLTTTAEVEQWLSTHIGDLPYYDYTQGSLISFNGSGLKATGKNLFDRNAIGDGFIDSDNGNVSTTYYKHSDYIRVLSNAKYTIKNFCWLSGNSGAFYDANKNYISGIVSSDRFLYTFTTPNNCNYIRLSLNNSYDEWETAQLEHGETATSYEPYTSNTLSLPTLTYFPFGEMSAGNVFDELTDGDVYKRIGVVDLGNLNWIRANTNLFVVSLPTRKVGDVYVGLKCALYQTIPTNISIYSMPDKTIKGNGQVSQNEIYIKDSSYDDASLFKSGVKGQYLYYELATPLHNYGVVDLGSLEWDYNSNNKQFNAELTNGKTKSDWNTNVLCPNFIVDTRSWADYSTPHLRGINPNGNVYIVTDQYNDSASFKTAMSGIYLLFEAQTPVVPSLDLTYPIWNGGTEQILPVNTSTPTTSGIVADIKYPDGIRYDQTFVYRVIEKATQLGNRALSIMLGKKVETDNPEEPLDILLKGEK